MYGISSWALCGVINLHATLKSNMESCFW